MTHTEGQMVEVEPSVKTLRKPVNETKRSTRWWHVDLEAARQARSVPRVLIAGEESIDRLSLALQPRAGFFPDPPGATGRLTQIFLPGEVVKSHGREPPLERHVYPSPSGGWTDPYSASNSASVAGS